MRLAGVPPATPNGTLARSAEPTMPRKGPSMHLVLLQRRDPPGDHRDARRPGCGAKRGLCQSQKQPAAHGVRQAARKLPSAPTTGRKTRAGPHPQRSGHVWDAVLLRRPPLSLPLRFWPAPAVSRLVLSGGRRDVDVPGRFARGEPGAALTTRCALQPACSRAQRRQFTASCAYREAHSNSIAAAEVGEAALVPSHKNSAL